MEDDILSIMLSKDDWDHNKRSTANEIASKIKKFIEWKDDNTEPFINPEYKGRYYCYYNPDESQTLDEVYQYWTNKPTMPESYSFETGV